MTTKFEEIYESIVNETTNDPELNEDEDKDEETQEQDVKEVEEAKEYAFDKQNFIARVINNIYKERPELKKDKDLKVILVKLSKWAGDTDMTKYNK